MICPSLGIGEIFTAIKLGERLSQDGNEIHFTGTTIIEEFSFIKKSNHTILTMDAKENSILLDQLVNEVKPDILIFTDYHMYMKNVYMRNVFDLDSLQKFHLPFYIIDTLGNCTFHDEKVSLYEKEVSITVPHYIDGILRPVPQHDAKLDYVSKRTKYFSVFDSKTTFEVEEEGIIKIKQSLGLDINRDTVVLTLGNWVKAVVTEAKYKLYLNLIRIVLHYLNSVGTDLEVVILGECNFEYNEFKHLKINKDLIDLSFEEADKLIQISSLLITLNRFSNSLCRAAYYHTPCMALVNSNKIEFTNKDITKDIPYLLSVYVKKILRLISLENKTIQEYTVFPENNTSIFQSFFDQNTMYSEIVPSYEILDEETIVKTMKEIILMKNNELKIKQKQFMKQAFLLPSPTILLKELNNGACSTYK